MADSVSVCLLVLASLCGVLWRVPRGVAAIAGDHLKRLTRGGRRRGRGRGGGRGRGDVEGGGGPRRTRLRCGGSGDAYFLLGAHVTEGGVAAHGLYVYKHFKVASGVC